MNEEEQMRFFYEVFDASLPRHGPGDDTSTQRALHTLLSATPDREGMFGGSGRVRVLDIGCGNGAQTLQLAKHVHGTITAVDNHQPFLDELVRRAEAEGVLERIRPRLADMRELNAEEGVFELIWSEGALYIMGFREGLEACRRLLASGGLLAVSELTWLRPDPQPECRDFFAAEYPAMVDIATNAAMIADCGYTDLGHFTLPESAWWASYYNPLQHRLDVLRERYVADTARIEMIESVDLEIETYRRYSRYYGYVFYLMRRD